MAEKTKVTRISAKDEAVKAEKPAKAASTKATKAVKAKKVRKTTEAESKNVFARMGAYFKGAWFELRQVRWPTRAATWSLTLAVILFSLFFVGLIVLLDLGFKSLFELIIT